MNSFHVHYSRFLSFLSLSALMNNFRSPFSSDYISFRRLLRPLCASPALIKKTFNILCFFYCNLLILLQQSSKNKLWIRRVIKVFMIGRFSFLKASAKLPVCRSPKLRASERQLQPSLFFTRTGAPKLSKCLIHSEIEVSLNRVMISYKEWASIILLN